MSGKGKYCSNENHSMQQQKKNRFNELAKRLIS